jgi:hypothetical protein
MKAAEVFLCLFFNPYEFLHLRRTLPYANIPVFEFLLEEMPINIGLLDNN